MYQQTKKTVVGVVTETGNTIRVEVMMAPGEKVVTASEALTAVLGGKVIRPHFHDNKLQIRYVRGKGLEWVGEPGVTDKVLSGPEYLWNVLNREPESLWIVPVGETQRGKWFDGVSKTYVAVSTMTDGHLDNALSWLSLKASELKAEQRRRANEKKAQEQKEAAEKAAKERMTKRRAKNQARFATKTYQGGEVLKALAQGKKLIQQRYTKMVGVYYRLDKEKGLMYSSPFCAGTPEKEISLNDSPCDWGSIATDTWVEVK